MNGCCAQRESRSRLWNGNGGAEGLRGGLPPTAVDKYLPLIYKEKANLFSYLRDGLLFVSEPARVKERVRTTLWQLEQDETPLKYTYVEEVSFDSSNLLESVIDGRGY